MKLTVLVALVLETEEKEWLTHLVTDLLAFDLNSPPPLGSKCPCGAGLWGAGLLFSSHPRIRLQDPGGKGGRMGF